MPKFTDIKVDNEVYVSSSGGYSTDVFMRENGKRITWSFWIDGGQFVGVNWGSGNFPVYVWKEVYRQLAERLADPKTRFYEYNQDRVRRWTNLRYYDAEFVKHLAALAAKGIP